MRVLIADDDKAFAEYLAALVWACDHEVVGIVTGGGLAVLQSYWEHRPDVLLLDVMMPKFNGFTVCQQLLSRDPGACVILMSGLVASDFPRISSCKARGFIGKPLAFEDLRAALNKVAPPKIAAAPAMELQCSAEEEAAISESSPALIEFPSSSATAAAGEQRPEAECAYLAVG